jgi:hypothetical protein
MPGILGADVQRHAARAVVVPQNRGETLVGRYQREGPDGGVHELVNVTLLSLISHGCCSPVILACLVDGRGST